MPTEADNVPNHEEADKSNEKLATERRIPKKKNDCEHKDLRLITKPLVMASNTSMAA